MRVHPVENYGEFIAEEDLHNRTSGGQQATTPRGGRHEAPSPEHSPQLGRQFSDARRNIILEEYKAMRAEVLAALQTQQQALGFGAAALGVAAAAGAQLWKDEQVLATTLLGVLVPVVACMVLALWLAEQVRLLRVGIFLMELEATVCGAMGEETLWWEHWSLKTLPGSDVEASQRRAVLVIFAFFAVGGVIAGALRATEDAAASIQVVVSVVATAIATALAWLLLRRGLGQIWRLREEKRSRAGLEKEEPPWWASEWPQRKAKKAAGTDI